MAPRILPFADRVWQRLDEARRGMTGYGLTVFEGTRIDTFRVVVIDVMRGAGRKRQSIAESSFDAWTKFYKQDANAPNAIVSYYAKGSLIALALVPGPVKNLVERIDGKRGLAEQQGEQQKHSCRHGAVPPDSVR